MGVPSHISLHATPCGRLNQLSQVMCCLEFRCAVWASLACLRQHFLNGASGVPSKEEAERERERGRQLKTVLYPCTTPNHAKVDHHKEIQLNVVVFFIFKASQCVLCCDPEITGSPGSSERSLRCCPGQL